MTVIYLLPIVLFLVGCGAKEPELGLQKDEVLAVAPFEQPRQNWELLAGYPAKGEDLSPRILQGLDELLAAKLQDAGREDYLGPDRVQQCKEQLASQKDRSRLSAVRFWSQVGECLQADYLLVPHILQWEEREGGKWGVQEPATVHFDLYLLDVQEQRLKQRFNFEEEQKALSQDLLQIRRFFQRRAKWISAKELAGEGMEKAMQEWGL
ncbi:MAG: hypothetical protein ACOC43_17080 [Desulfohalobiaceae bacterium]